MLDNIPTGPTGRFPHGKIRDDDEGEIHIAIGASKGQVIIDFGGPVAWMGFTPDDARELALSLVKHACALDGKPFVFKL
jgi:hypothetical protein